MEMDPWKPDESKRKVRARPGEPGSSAPDAAFRVVACLDVQSEPESQKDNGGFRSHDAHKKKGRVCHPPYTFGFADSND